MKKDIKNLTLKELKQELAKIGAPAYRAEQIFFWIYQKGVSEFSQMSNIGHLLQGKLEQGFYISAFELNQHQRSIDGTEKFLFRLRDGNFIETVLIYAKQRKTVCLSTQVGCKFACLFCASGSRGFLRQLETAEIVNQILYLKHIHKCDINNFVFMGMGEPLDNFKNLSKAIILMNAPQALKIGARTITVSTCGLVPEIERLQRLGLQVNLSVSLHAANNKLRDMLLPVNKRYPLEQLIQACAKFRQNGGRMITLEYILIKGKNDSLTDADALVIIARKLKAKVNLIWYSPIDNLNLRPSSEEAAALFFNRLVLKKIKVTLRESRGKDIQAACGQLAGWLKGP